MDLNDSVETAIQAIQEASAPVKGSSLVGDVRAAYGCLEQVRARMRGILFERETEIDGVLMAIVAESTALFLGPVGTAKTMLVTVACSLMELQEFEILMSEMTKLQEIFGPLDIPALGQGRQVYKWQSYAPGADILFFDEMFKSNGTVLNPLLWLINDQVFRDGDNGKVKSKASTTFAASNELPRESILAALYDRMVLRYHVEYMQEPASLKTAAMQFLGLEKRGSLEPIMKRDQVEILRAACKQVDVPDAVFKSATAIRASLVAKNISVSDRRFFHALKLVRAAALINGRDYCELEDLGVFAHIFWETYEDRPVVTEVVAKYSTHGSEVVTAYLEEATLISKDLIKGNLADKLSELKRIYKALKPFKGLYVNDVRKKVRAWGDLLEQRLEQRKTLIVTRTHSAREGCDVFRLDQASADAWNHGALTALGLRLRKNPKHYFTTRIAVFKRNALDQGLRVEVRNADE